MREDEGTLLVEERHKSEIRNPKSQVDRI
jgi:hypothetical protein